MHTLPRDVLPHIFSFFTLEELYHNLQYVNKEWNFFIQCSKPSSSGGDHVTTSSVSTNNTTATTATDTRKKQPWIDYQVSCFRNGIYFRQFNGCDSKVNNTDHEKVDDPFIEKAVWDDRHTELIFSCLEKRKAVDDYTVTNGGELKKSTGTEEMIKSMQFLYLVHYDKELAKRILNDDSTITGCLYSLNEDFVTAYQDRINEKYKDESGRRFMMDLLHIESNLKGVDDQLFLYKIFERVFALDLDVNWSSVFPCIQKCTLLKKKPEVLIRKMFKIELEVLLKMLLNICAGGLYQPSQHVIFAFANYCLKRFSTTTTTDDDCCLVKLSELVIVEINKKVLREHFDLLPILPKDEHYDREMMLNKKNYFISLYNMNLYPLALIDYKSLYCHVSLLLEFLYRRGTVSEMFRGTKRRDFLQSLQMKLHSYFVHQLVRINDLEGRAQFLEKMEQAFVYAVKLKDFRTAYFFSGVLNIAGVHRLKLTHEHVERSSNFKNLWEDCNELIDSKSSYKKLHQFIDNHPTESIIPMHIPLSYLTFVEEGNSNQSRILLMSYNLVTQFQRSLRIPSKIGSNESQHIDKKTVKIIDKKGLKQSIKSFFDGGSKMVGDVLLVQKDWVDFFVFVLLNYVPLEDKEIYKMSLIVEPRK